MSNKEPTSVVKYEEHLNRCRVTGMTTTGSDIHLVLRNGIIHAKEDNSYHVQVAMLIVQSQV